MARHAWTNAIKIAKKPLPIAIAIAIGLGAGMLCSIYAMPIGIHIAPAENLAMTVIGDTQQADAWTLQAAAPEHRQLAAWLQANQYGWSPYLATTIGSGLVVDAGMWRLQFVGHTVLACPRQHSCQQKQILPEHYAFLLGTRAVNNAQ